MQKHIRKSLRQLLGYKHSQNRLVSATQDECQRFDRSGSFADGPNLDSFRLDFVLNKRKSLWNKRATDLFTERFLREGGGDEEYGCLQGVSEKTVIDAFWVALRNLKLNYLKEATAMQPPSPEQSVEQELQKRAMNAGIRRDSVSKVKIT